MCRFTISTHTYSGCKLVEETQDETPTPRATFLGRITNAFVTTTPGENTPLVTNEDGRHVITQKEIIQCSKALDDPAQNGKLPGERRCTKLTPLRKEEGIPAEPPLSKFKGGCPACQAGEDAVRAALTKETIVSGAIFQKRSFSEAELMRSSFLWKYQ